MRVRGYPDNLVNKVLSEVKFTDIQSTTRQAPPERDKNNITPFVTLYNLSEPNLKIMLMSNPLSSSKAVRSFQWVKFHKQKLGPQCISSLAGGESSKDIKKYIFSWGRDIEDTFSSSFV